MTEKKIYYPTTEWLEKWVDKYLDENPEVKFSEEINELAEAAWWDKEVDKGHATPFDLTEEETKEAKKARMGAKNEHKFVKRKEPVKRERKPNEVKRMLIEFLNTALAANADVLNVEVTNIERELTFGVGEKKFSLTLVEHRPPKADKELTSK